MYFSCVLHGPWTWSQMSCWSVWPNQLQQTFCGPSKACIAIQTSYYKLYACSVELETTTKWLLECAFQVHARLGSASDAHSCTATFWHYVALFSQLLGCKLKRTQAAQMSRHKILHESHFLARRSILMLRTSKPLKLLCWSLARSSWDAWASLLPG
jgi:hypothetical protein